MNKIIWTHPWIDTWTNLKLIAWLFKNWLNKNLLWEGVEIDEEIKGDPSSGFSCSKCWKIFDDFHFEKILFLEECGHIVCKSCISEITRENYPTHKKVMCP